MLRLADKILNAGPRELEHSDLLTQASELPGRGPFYVLEGGENSEIKLCWDMQKFYELIKPSLNPEEATEIPGEMMKIMLIKDQQAIKTGLATFLIRIRNQIQLENNLREGLPLGKLINRFRKMLMEVDVFWELSREFDPFLNWQNEVGEMAVRKIMERHRDKLIDPLTLQGLISLVIAGEADQDFLVEFGKVGVKDPNKKTPINSGFFNK